MYLFHQFILENVLHDLIRLVLTHVKGWAHKGMRRSGRRAAMAFLDWIGIVRALLGMLYADGDLLAAAAGFSNTVRPNGTVQRAGDDLGIGRGVMKHLLLDGLCTLLQRTVHARAELQIGRHVGQVVL